MKIPDTLRMELLDHLPEGDKPAFTPNYEPNDIGENYDLTVSVFGYELDYDAVAVLMHELNVFRNNVVIDQRRKIKNLKEQ